PPPPLLIPYPPLFRSRADGWLSQHIGTSWRSSTAPASSMNVVRGKASTSPGEASSAATHRSTSSGAQTSSCAAHLNSSLSDRRRSEEHTSELQSRENL